MKVSTPSPCAQSRKAAAPKTFSHAATQSRLVAVAGDKQFAGFGVGEIEAALAGHEELAAHRRHGVIHIDGHPRRRQDFGRHQAGGAGTDDADARNDLCCPAGYLVHCANIPAFIYGTSVMV